MDGWFARSLIDRWVLWPASSNLPLYCEVCFAYVFSASSFLQFFKIFVTNTDPMTSAPVYGTASVLCSYVDYRQPSGGGPVLIACDSPVTGRYVVIQARDSQTITLCEVDVYGKL